MRTHSLVRRGIVSVLLVESICAVALSSTALWHEWQTRLHSLDVEVQGRSDSLLGAIQDAEDPEDNVFVDPEELKMPGQDVYAVYNEGGRILGSSQAAPPALIARTTDGVRTVYANGRTYRVLQREALRIIDREENHGVGLRRPVTILYASPTTHMWHEVLEAGSFYILLSLALVCTTTAVLIVLLRWMLKPLEELALAASEVRVATPAFEAPISALELRELKPLAEAISGTISRLREALELQHRFVGDAAHELKTAVAVVRSSIQVLDIRPRSPEEYRTGMDRVLRDNERVEALLARMLTLARFEEKQEIHNVRVDMHREVRGALVGLQTFAAACNVDIAFAGAPGLHVRIVPDAVEVLISNLVVNAIQHSPQGGTVLVSLREQSLRAKKVILEIEDAGEGVAPEMLPHVFERFFRVDRSRSRQTGGAGLGLAICKSIVEAANGSIEMLSEPGRSTVVRATFSLD
jgi:signal transduction histidine kinase